MSKNLDQIYIANPIFSNASTDLMYCMQNPYTPGTDAAIQFSDFATQFVTPAQLQKETWVLALDSGTANHYVLTLNLSPGSYTDGLTITFTPSHPNNTACTVNVMGIGIVNIVTNANQALVGGEILLNGKSTITYSGAFGAFILVNPFATPITAQALTRTNDTNVTVTLGGTPATALLQPVSLTLGWTGQLGLSRGGTASDLSATGGTSQVLKQSSAGAAVTVGQLAASDLSNGTTGSGAVALATSPTFVTPVLGTPTSGTLTNCTGLPVAGGGTGNSTFTAYSVICAGTTATGAFQNVSGVGTSGQVLTSNGAGALPTWQAAGAGPWSSGAGTNSGKGGGATSATQTDSLAWGSGSTSTHAEAIALGNGANATGDNAIALGLTATASGSNAYCLGSQSTASGNFSTVIGNSNIAAGNFSVAMGVGAHTNNSGSFVWSDANENNHQDSAGNQFIITAAGGYFYYQNSSLIYSIDTNGNIINNKGTADQSYSLQTPSTGFSITIGAGVKTLLLNPAGTLATGTITMPASPIKGQEIRFSSTQIVTSLTVSANAGQSIMNAPTTIAAGQGFGYIYDLASTTWFRLY